MENFGVGGNLVIEIAAGNYTFAGHLGIGFDRTGTLGAVDDVMVSNVATTVTIRAATGATVMLVVRRRSSCLTASLAPNPVSCPL